MRRLPRLTGTDVVRALERAGSALVRRRGSHCILRHPDGRTTTVPVHAHEELGPGLLGKIPRDTELSADALQTLL